MTVSLALFLVGLEFCVREMSVDAVRTWRIPDKFRIHIFYIARILYNFGDMLAIASSALCFGHYSPPPPLPSTVRHS